MNNSKYDFFSSFVMLVVAIMFMLVLFVFAIELFRLAKLPLVRFSYASQKCVQVVNFEDHDSFTCENLPTKYIHEWVE